MCVLDCNISVCSLSVLNDDVLATTKDRLYYWYDDVTLDDMIELYNARHNESEWRLVRQKLYALRRRQTQSQSQQTVDAVRRPRRNSGSSSSSRNIVADDL